MHLAWLTDLHLNFVDPDCVDGLCRRIRDEGADAVLISGDIAEAPGVEAYLEFLGRRIDRPIFFVLGNHDFYRGSIGEVRARVAAFCAAISPTPLAEPGDRDRADARDRPRSAMTAGPTGGSETMPAPTCCSTTSS